MGIKRPKLNLPFETFFKNRINTHNSMAFELDTRLDTLYCGPNLFHQQLKEPNPGDITEAFYA
jgi:hypothetical protein